MNSIIRKLNSEKLIKSSEVELTILMPCLNEESTVGECIDEAAQFIKSQGIKGEILICDNGSTDSSPTVAKNHGAKVVFCPDRGYGNALRYGLLQAAGEFIIMGDCDLSYPFSEIGEMYHLLKSGEDMVIGNRFTKGAPESDAMSLSHRFGVPFLSMIARLRFHCDVKDFHCGLRGVRKSALETLSLKATGMEFATEMIAKGCVRGIRIAQTPVTLRPDGRGRQSKLRTVRDGFRHLWFIVKGVK